METEPCMSIKKRMIVICYVDDLSVFAEKNHRLSRKDGTGQEITSKRLRKPVQFWALK